VWRVGRDAPDTAGRLAERKRRLQPSLVVAQVALAVVLVVSAGLLGRSVLSLRAVPLGFDTDGVWTFETRLPWTDEGWDEARFGAFARAVSDRLREHPDVTEVGVTSQLPLSESLGAGFRIWPAGADEDAMMFAGSFSVSPGYFDAMAIRFLAGSAFDAGAGETGIVISRTVAQRLFGRANVVGEQVRTRYSMQQDPATRTITGVVDDLRPRGFLGEPRPAMYPSFDASPAPSMAFAVRTTAHAATVDAMVREAVMQADPSVAPFSIRSMRSAADRAIAERDALAIVSGLFAAMALLLAVLGIYGLIAQSVVRRRRELGIRIAVGARSRDLLLMVLRGSVLLASAGIAIGLLASLGATRLLAGFLFGVRSTDPPTFAAVAGLVLLVAAVAALVPAGRAAAADPVTSLRSD
jgi:putative ABC transport system permease protein